MCVHVHHSDVSSTRGGESWSHEVITSRRIQTHSNGKLHREIEHDGRVGVSFWPLLSKEFHQFTHLHVNSSWNWIEKEIRTFSFVDAKHPHSGQYHPISKSYVCMLTSVLEKIVNIAVSSTTHIMQPLSELIWMQKTTSTSPSTGLTSERLIHRLRTLKMTDTGPCCSQWKAIKSPLENSSYKKEK